MSSSDLSTASGWMHMPDHESIQIRQLATPDWSEQRLCRDLWFVDVKTFAGPTSFSSGTIRDGGSLSREVARETDDTNS